MRVRLRWMGAVCALAVWCGVLAGTAHAQLALRDSTGESSSAPPPQLRWRLVVDGQPEAWPAPAGYPVDSLRPAARAAVAALQREGYYFARLDSARVDTSRMLATVHLYVRRGPEVRLAQLRFEGVTAFDETVLRRAFYTRAGQTLRPDRLEADLEALLARYEEAGYPLAQVRVEEARLVPGDPPALVLTIGVEEGGSLRIRRIEMAGAERTSAAYVSRVAGLYPGQPLMRYDPEAVQQRLRETGFFREVGAPALRIDEGGGAVVRVPVEEEPPGAFDLVLGYLPPATEGGAGRIVGSGHLALRNLFGGGRVLSLRLDRRPGQVTSVDAEVSDPYFLGLPFAVEGFFEGFQQDSTYGKRGYGLALGYRLAESLSARATLRREVTRPGQAGAALRNSRQRVPRAEALFIGVGLRYQRVDRLMNPRRGFLIETQLARGRKARSFSLVTVEGDTTRRRETLRQERLEGAGRLYLPVSRRQVAVLGAEGALLLSDDYDPSDLFRFGGAASLRGYDEDRFLGSAVARALAEYRYQLEQRSYAYLFFDLGYVRTPALTEQERTRQGWHPGYGLGLQFQTRLGLVNASYALNTEDGITGGRVHLGLSVGL